MSSSGRVPPARQTGGVELSLKQVKALVDCALSRKGVQGSGRSDDWQRLLDLGYVRKLPPRGFDDTREAFLATEAGLLRLTNPSMLLIQEVMDA